ncbi:uncharacterized protein LOC113229273 [Hyposmocoma kahamanoa]|uniref:uncharacterized protein LOC113229273 n=1 Tax=Hyposmocoma kahamanoa TaxID=1477025 RepID=UPI000E6D73C5|nr:uncharacterized protein LOC113229273 [Hyposmocoma kahamanoa]
MTQKSFKFGTADNIKFIELYRSYECLWNTEHEHYKNRDARNAALNAFAREFGSEEFGPKEISGKIKNIRSQYLQEKKKVSSSLGTGAGAENVYVPKLPWYNSLDSFLRKSSEFRTTFSNLIDESTPNTPNSPFNVSVVNNDETHTFQILDSVSDIVDLTPKPTQTKKTKTRKLDIDSAIDRLDAIDKRSRQYEDDLDMFGKYVASSLRKLNEKNMIFAQDEIQATLSKFKLKNLKETTPMPDSPFSRPDSDLQWWNASVHDDTATVT